MLYMLVIPTLLVNGFNIVLTGRDGGASGQADSVHTTELRSSNTSPSSGTRPEGFPTPASLAEVMLSTRQMLNEQTAESLHVCFHFPILLQLFIWI